MRGCVGDITRGTFRQVMQATPNIKKTTSNLDRNAWQRENVYDAKSVRCGDERRRKNERKEIRKEEREQTESCQKAKMR